MLNENAKNWVVALRSGEYRQGKKYLHSADNTFCCLGVACDLAVKTGFLDKPELNEDHFKYPDPDFSNPRSGFLPDMVVTWLGLRDNSGNFENTSLVTMNDSDYSFLQIADMIESEPRGLFNASL